MKIGTPEITHDNNKVQVHVPVHFDPALADRRAPNIPEALWYEFPAEYEADLYLGPEPFISALIPLAMAIGETIEVTAPISPRFAFNADRFMRVYAYWSPTDFQTVPILTPGYQVPPAREARGSALMFSGGVDSFHTLYSHLHDNQKVPPYCLTHGIFLFHFDQREHERPSYKQAAEVYSQLFTDLGLKLICADFNTGKFAPSRKWMSDHRFQSMTHGAKLAGVGGVLAGGLERLYLASSNKFTTTIVYGTSILTVTLLSTETFDVVHSGFDRTRGQKVIELSEWPATYDHLRVCWWQPQGVQNCGRCHKCVRTMTTLEILGRLQDYSTFTTPLRTSLILRRNTVVVDRNFGQEHLAAAGASPPSWCSPPASPGCATGPAASSNASSRNLMGFEKGPVFTVLRCWHGDCFARHRSVVALLFPAWARRRQANLERNPLVFLYCQHPAPWFQ